MVKKYNYDNAACWYSNYTYVIENDFLKKDRRHETDNTLFPLHNIIHAYDTFQNAARDKTLKIILTNGGTENVE